MTKNEACPVCEGRGYTIGEECINASWRKWCGNCQGTGVIQVPMTKADQFRSLSDEELSDAFYNLIYCEEPAKFFCHGTEECRAMVEADEDIPEEWCRKCLLEELRKPVKEPRLPSGLFLDKQESGLVEED